MKILSLIELTRGTGISQYLSSFAMIEGENVMILDTNKHSILDGLLGIDDTSTQNNRYGKHSYCNNKNCYEMDIYFGRFHNLYLRCLQFTEQPSVDLINNMAQSIKAHSSFRNCRYLLIYFPFRDDFNGIKEIISNSDYSVIFSVDIPMIPCQ